MIILLRSDNGVVIMKEVDPALRNNVLKYSEIKSCDLHKVLLYNWHMIDVR